MAKAQATYDEIKKLQLPFSIYPDDTILISHRGIAKIINLEELSTALSKLMNRDIAKQIYDSLAKVAHTGSYFDLIDCPPPDSKMIIRAPNGIYWQLNVDDEGDLYLTKAFTPTESIHTLVGPNGKYWTLKVDNNGELRLVEGDDP